MTRPHRAEEADQIKVGHEAPERPGRLSAWSPPESRQYDGDERDAHLLLSRRTDNFIRLRFESDPTAALPVDLMLVSEETYERIQSASLRRAIGNELTLAIPSALHLIAMKLHALKNPQRVERGTDLQDVRHLIRTAGVDISGPEFTAILDRYATDEIRRVIESEFGK